jgi:hypothetical protein
MQTLSEIVEGLRKKEPFCNYPRKGGRYVITEWDGTREMVEVIDTGPDTVLFQYPDGELYRVSPEYFEYHIRAEEYV